MQVIDDIKELTHLTRNWSNSKKIGFVPTMGALHEGHLALVKQSIDSCDITVVSIFVNPSQFGPNEDYGRYPKTFENDYKELVNLGVDYIFLPSAHQMYPENYRTWVSIDEITTTLCGASRPGHFTGVATIVLKLVNLVSPTLMFMGEKDFQQVVVLETMLRDLNIETKIIRCPIVRAETGLALSSRNRYLSAEEAKVAPEIYNSMVKAKASFKSGIDNPQGLIAELQASLEAKGMVIDYIQIVDSFSLQSVDLVTKGNRLIIAVILGKTRLIDNIEI
ncbi:MAG: pantoate--beta-alanine ligase [Candidatus Cloacimonadales bacterium]